MEKEVFFTVHETAEMYGISVRTLQYYDEIGLLVPKRRDNGYRVYDLSDFDRLETILMLKSSGMELKEMGRVLSEGSMDEYMAVMERQKDVLDQKIFLLSKQKEEIEKRIETLHALHSMPQEEIVLKKEKEKIYRKADYTSMQGAETAFIAAESNRETLVSFDKKGMKKDVLEVRGEGKRTVTMAYLVSVKEDIPYRKRVPAFLKKLHEKGYVEKGDVLTIQYMFSGTKRYHILMCECGKKA